MSLIGLQKRISEAGRIRLGEKLGNRPSKLTDSLRFTSISRANVEAVAAAYGGQVVETTIDNKTQYEVKVARTEIPVLIAPGDISQSWEAWTRGQCLIRVKDRPDVNEVDGSPLGFDITDPDARASRNVKAKSRVSVLLPEVEVLGRWRVETGGIYAAVELGGLVEVLAEAGIAPHQKVPATLRIEERRSYSGATRQFTVLVVEPRGSLTGLTTAIEAAAEEAVARKVAAAQPTTVAIADAAALVEADRSGLADLGDLSPTGEPTGELVTAEQAEAIQIGFAKFAVEAGPIVHAVTDGRTSTIEELFADEVDGLREALKAAVRSN